MSRIIMPKLVLAALLTVIQLAGFTQIAWADPLPVADIRQRVDNHNVKAVELFREFLSLPNDATHPEDIEKLV